MAVCYKIENENFSLGLWKLDENENQLLDIFTKIAPPEEIYKAEKIKYTHRKAEWIATRLLTYHLLNQVITIDYDSKGKPLIYNNSKSISISHTKGMVAVIIANHLTGIDIELVSDRVQKIESKFMSEIELKQIPDSEKSIQLLMHWSAKETLYKISGGKDLIFKNNLYINPIVLSNKGEFIGEIITDNQNTVYSLNYFFFEQNNFNTNYLIVYYYN